MAEARVDISKQKSPLVCDLSEQDFDMEITVFGHADENILLFLGSVKVINHGFDGSPKLADAAVTKKDALGHYHWVRDEIRDFVLTLSMIME